MKALPRFSVVVPVFNEEQVIQQTYQRLKKVMEDIGESYELIFVDDGSRDETACIIEEVSKGDRCVRLISFSRNFGHQIAISAGMDYAKGQAVVVIDADLQDPPELIAEMAQKWREGYDVVYGKRIRRNGETLFKKWSASVFYRLLSSLTNVNIPVDAGDFRLIDRKVCDVLKNMKEKSRYIRGLVSWAGFRQIAVEYVREERWAGETKYPLRKMVHFALDGITSFSNRPLRFASYIGFLMSFCSFLYLIIVLYQKFFTENTVAGWASTIALNLFFNGVVLILLGVIGEYIGRIYEESKERPLYIVRNMSGFEEKNTNEDERETK